MGLILGALLAVGCTSPCEEPFFAGKASDEVWMAFVDAESRVQVDDARASALGEPSEGQTFDGNGAPPTFRWTSSLSATRGLPRLPPARSRPRWRLSDLFISSAWAHLPPVTGPVHSLRIDVPGRACPIRALTTDTEWAVPAEAFAEMRSSEELKLEITSAYVRENRITEGPFRPSQIRTFRVVNAP